ncbi:hypothetical protein ACWD4L_48940 [Streptomyces sp. NPDC002596]
MIGRAAETGVPGFSRPPLHSTYQSGKSDSPGYSAEQTAEVARYQAELLRLSTEVATHPYWATLDSGVVAARMALKHAHEAADEAA